MKRFLLLFVIAWFGTCLLRTQGAEVSVDLFYDQLSPYGEWVDAGEYGYAWHPREVGEDWRPYTDGHWAFTDAGWTWVSEEPFAWAVYHYGRWAKLVDVGWIWVPDREWGPAWVSFRRSKRHVGWAPLPPEATFGREVRTISNWSDSYYDIGPTQYTFVEVRNFGAPRLREVILPPRQNITIITETTNITNIRVENNVVYTGGPEYEVITRESAQPIQRLRLERRTDVTVSDRAAFRTAVQGDTLRIAAPVIQTTSTNVAPPKVARKIEKLEVNRGWHDAGDPAATEKLHAKIKSEAQVPAGLPPKPTFQKTSATAATEAPANAPKGTAEAPASPNPKSPGAPNEKSTSSTQPTATTPAPPENATPQPNAVAGKGKKGKRGIATTPAPTATTEPNTNNPSAGATAEKMATPQPGAVAEKGKKGKRGAAATPAPTATTESNNPPAAVSPEKTTSSEPSAVTGKGKKGQRPGETAPSAQTETAPSTPATTGKKGMRKESPAAETSNPPGGPTPEGKPQKKEQKKSPAEATTRPESTERPPESPAGKSKDRESGKKPESKPESQTSSHSESANPHQPKAESQSPAARGEAQNQSPENKGKKKDENKGEKKGEKKPEGAQQ